MTIKKTQTILAYGSHNPQHTPLAEGIPITLLEEAREFINRNSITKDRLSDKKVCCMRCLKAHLMNRSKELGFEEEIVENFPLIEDEIAGHSGYYMDEGKLKRVIE